MRPPRAPASSLRDGKAEARALGVARHEGTEDALRVVGRDARPGVRHVDPDGAVGRVEPDADGASVGRPAERVLQQVRDHLEDAVAVRDDRRRPVDPAQRVPNLPPARLVAERVVRVLHEVAHVDLLGLHGEPVGAELREVEHVADESLEPGRLVRDDLERRRHELRVVDQPVAERVDVALDRGEGRPELVRDRHQELALALLRRREAGGHLVEAVGKVRDLVAAAPHRDLNGVVSLRDLIRRLRERLHGPADPPREPRSEEPREEAPDGEGGGEPRDERQPLVANDVLGLRDDDRADCRPATLEPDRLRGRKVRAVLPRRFELELERPSRGEDRGGHRGLGEPVQTRLLPRERRCTHVEELVAGRELESVGREVGRRRPLVGGAQRSIPVQTGDAPRLPAQLLVRPAARVAGEELHGDERGHHTREHDPEEEEGRQPETQRPGHHREAYAPARRLEPGERRWHDDRAGYAVGAAVRSEATL